ncbi:hypothetical protein [Polynucleobacter sp. UK-Kesae-W10]|uniref:hypothetical protein n=1 Tax=Polynucleobacter sp. UK-Kesae-W10 TaxID=1819738 RepID=UPI001C0E78E1|nr:hypothetical protein [Polynucleobacter sp. UK-Kesae-W10]MBU3577487.1 hypothetical protein [Polynucleobacter sp. UK-Kesae-W10]
MLTNILTKTISEIEHNLEESGNLPDGTIFNLANYPLPQTHWSVRQAFNVPPMPMRMGAGDPRRERMSEALQAAGEYAVRMATNNGELAESDPDEFIDHLEVGFFGYFTEDGLSDDEWNNPPESGEYLDLLGEQDPDASWLSLAHVICSEAGIPNGDIADRLSLLRDILETLRTNFDNMDLS